MILFNSTKKWLLTKQSNLLIFSKGIVYLNAWAEVCPWEEKETCDTSDDKNLTYVIPFPQATAVPYMVSIL